MRQALVALAGILPLAGTPLGRAESPAMGGLAAAVIVHTDNPVTDLKLRELRSMLRLERQFWPGGRRSFLYLPPSGAASKKIVLDRIYRMTDDQLRRYWMGKIYAGEIPSMPSVVRTAKAAGKVVRKSQGALAVVLARDAPDDVRVLSIDGTLPGDPDYPLVAPPAP